MIRNLLILLGKPGYWLIVFVLNCIEKVTKLIASKGKNILLNTPSFLEKIFRTITFFVKNISLKIKNIFSFPLKKTEIKKKRGRGRPKAKKNKFVSFWKKLKDSWQKIILFFQRISERIKQFRLIKKKRGRPSKTTVIRIRKPKKTAFVLITIGTFLISVGLAINLFYDLPSPDSLVDRQPSLTTKIYDRNGILLYKIYNDQNRTLVPLSKIPDHLIKATLAVEDKEFYSHNGLSLKGISRAIQHNLFHPDEPQIGGSTITQQLVKNALLTSEKTWKRKIREALLAILVEMKFSKDEILQMYFNEVPYGGTAYGAEEAAEKYFDKHIWETNAAETALLAGFTKAPTKYSPYGAYPEYAKQRQEYVISQMVAAGYISFEEGEGIAATPLNFAPQTEPIKAPHFVFYVKDLLAEEYGQKMVEQGGLEVITSLDWNIQQIAQDVVTQEVNSLARLNITNGAALVTNPKTGEILAMVGSKDYFDFENDGNVNVTLRPRQPGSSIKPVNYAVALNMGYTPATIIPDTPITYQIPGQTPYSPKNYDNKFHGNVPLRTALASSLNVPAVKVLSSYGVDKMIDMGKSLGITTWEDRSRFGLSLTLGGGEIKMIDLAQAYSTFANLGKKVATNPILQIKDQTGKIIYRNLCNDSYCRSSKVLSPEVSFLINDILSDNYARAMAFGTNSLLNIPGKKVAVKTGTTNSLRDNWTIGYTPSYLAATWVGNNDNSPMSYVASGITGATPIWRKIMDNLLEGKPDEQWVTPEGVERVAICQTTGTLPCENCPKVVYEYFIKGTEPKKYCKLEVSPTPTP